MTEEAREAAARSFRHELEDNGGFTAGERAMLVMTYDRAWAEGVREGIRRSRAELEVWKSDAPTTGHVYYSEAIRAIDALEAEK